MMQKGRLMNFRRPKVPWYRDRHPDDHNLQLMKWINILHYKHNIRKLPIYIYLVILFVGRKNHGDSRR